MELVDTLTADGLRLQGILQGGVSQPADSAAKPPSCDAWLLLHGTGSNFYSSRLLATLAERLSVHSAVVRANTRGHDVLANGNMFSQRWIGAAFERVGDCLLDLDAWLELLTTRGYQRIGLLGHSLGAVKSVYWLANRAQVAPPVCALVAVSPPRLSHSHFLTSDKRDEFQTTFQTAEAHIAAGQPDAMMLVRFPLTYYVTAAAYVDRYGPAESYSVLKWLPKISVPALVTHGSRELQSDVAFQGMPEAIEQLPAGNASRQVAVIAGADHSYAAAELALADRVELWLSRLGPG